MTEKYFPQVGDNELMLTEMPHMNLYTRRAPTEKTASKKT